MRYSRALPREGLPLRHIGHGAGNVHRASCIVRASWRAHPPSVVRRGIAGET